MRKVAVGDEAAFGDLYDCFDRSLYALGLQMLRDEGRAEELVQETMVKVWRTASSFDSTKGRVSSWVFTVARRTGIDLIRKQGRTPIPVDSATDAPDEQAAEEQMWRHWEIGVLLRALSDDQRIAIERCIIDGYTHAEVAGSLGVPLSTVKTRVYSGLRRLREQVERLDRLEASS